MAKRYLLCIMVDPKDSKTGVTFEDWPLHISVVPWFTPGSAIKQINTKLEKLTASIPKTTVNVGQSAMFGENEDVPVNEIVQKHLLQPMHDTVIMLLELMDIEIVGKNKVGPAWRPHITHQGDKKKSEGDELKINAVCLVSKADENSRKKQVEKVFEFA